MERFSVNDRRVELFGTQHAGAPLVVLNTLEDPGTVYRAVNLLLAGEGLPKTNTAEALPQEAGLQRFTLAGISSLDWDRELTPWPAPPVRKDGEAFRGEGDLYLRELTEEIIPEIRKRLPAEPSRLVIAGYSLAGLFAIWSLYQTDLFDAAVSASGSLWYPGFAEFAAEHAMKRPPHCISLSLGDRESQTRHPVMKTVGACTEMLAERFRACGIPTVYELEPGNHFQDPAGRMARAIFRALREPKE